MDDLERAAGFGGVYQPEHEPRPMTVRDLLPPGFWLTVILTAAFALWMGGIAGLVCLAHAVTGN